MAGRLTAGLRALDPAMEVRILPRQLCSPTKPLTLTDICVIFREESYV